ncbi:UNVERIFIED_CONTAM: hypothetical protein K2H54_054989 [Gekko kuhli]
MSTDEKSIIPITTREITPVTTGMGATPGEEGAGESSEVPNPFGGATAMTTTRLTGLKWGWFSADMQETWTLTPATRCGSRYEASGRMRTILGDARTGTGHESAGAVKKGPEKVRPDSPVRKLTAYPKIQCAFQMSYPEEDPELEKDNEDETVGKGQDLL